MNYEVHNYGLEVGNISLLVCRARLLYSLVIVKRCVCPRCLTHRLNHTLWVQPHHLLIRH